MKFEAVIGLEVHVELRTERKMFCSCPADWFGKPENSCVCPVCLGLPGALPVPNREAFEWTLRLALALGCSINHNTYFERKHYFYPDLPKGYQISQYHMPLGYDGNLDGIEIERVHLEEDTGKLLYKTDAKGAKHAEVDYNRSGVPLVEIVTKPVIHDVETAVAYLKKLRTRIVYLGVSDADMEKGSMRCEPNISIRPLGQKELPSYKVEVKNINSFKFVQKAIEHELKRHESIISSSKTPKQETRRYMEALGTTESMRSKEEARDYRYMPEPDIPPISLTEKEIEIQREIVQKIELPEERYKYFVSTFGITPSASQVLVDHQVLGNKIHELNAKKLSKTALQKAANMLVNDKNARNISTEELATIVQRSVETKTVDQNLLDKTIEQTITKNEKAVADYKSGNTSALNVLVGMTMRELKGTADAGTVIMSLKKRLDT